MMMQLVIWLVTLKKQKKQINLAIIKTSKNLGYAGSQKLAYSIFSDQKFSKKIIMLHSDGQYDPSLIKCFEPYFSKNNDIVYGARNKKIFKEKRRDSLSHLFCN